MPHDPDQHNRKIKTTPIMSLQSRDGILVEMIFRPEERECRLLAFQDGETTEHASMSLDGHEYVPYSSENNLLTHRVVLLPSELGDYESDSKLLAEVQAFIHKYVDVSEDFEEVSAHYVLMTWRYDMWNELPYLRVRGQYGNGKSRFLMTVGSICFKPIFASGASTISPIFRLLDEVGGTLVIDEADFRASDERAEMVKILNNGHERGFPVLRSEVTPSKEFSPRAFTIFGPKLVASRHAFEDEALESRCLTESLGTRPLRADIPISLPPQFEAEALALRNKLLSFRFRRFEAPSEERHVAPAGVTPRRAQILASILNIAQTADARQRLSRFAEGNHSSESQAETDRMVLSSVMAAMVGNPGPVTLKAVAAQLQIESAGRYGAEVANRWIGGVLRKLKIELHKSNGIYAIPVVAFPRLRQLFEMYQLGDVRDDGDVHASDGAAGRTPGASSPSSPKSLPVD